MDKKNLKAHLTEMGGLPKDVVFQVPIVTLIGRDEASVENYRGILEYTDRLIRIQTKIGSIRVVGQGLAIESYNNEDMKILGHITQIEFCEGG